MVYVDMFTDEEYKVFITITYVGWSPWVLKGCKLGGDGTKGKSHIHCLQNQRVDFSQYWWETSLGVGDPKLLIWYI